MKPYMKPCTKIQLSRKTVRNCSCDLHHSILQNKAGCIVGKKGSTKKDLCLHKIRDILCIL